MRPRGELFEVVEHEQDAEAEEVGDERVERVEVDGLKQAERGGHPGDHEARFAHGGEVDGHGAAGEGRRLVPRTAIASLVLPTPPGPVTVTSRWWPDRRGRRAPRRRSRGR